MTKEDFLARCEAQWDSVERLDDESIDIMYLCMDYVMRDQAWQSDLALESWNEIQRISWDRILANNQPLYNALTFTARLKHPCDKCAQDKNNWVTRPSYCDHKTKF